MQVRVYRNLHRHCLSVQTRTPKGWRVTNHVQAITLDDVTFKVSEAGRQRCLREGRKNVHAFAIGTLDARVLPGAVATVNDAWSISYNPHRAPTFERRLDGMPVRTARRARLTTHGILAEEPRS